jgi:hypothetical protein
LNYWRCLSIKFKAERQFFSYGVDYQRGRGMPAPHFDRVNTRYFVVEFYIIWILNSRHKKSTICALTVCRSLAEPCSREIMDLTISLLFESTVILYLMRSYGSWPFSEILKWYYFVHRTILEMYRGNKIVSAVHYQISRPHLEIATTGCTKRRRVLICVQVLLVVFGEVEIYVEIVVLESVSYSFSFYFTKLARRIMCLDCPFVLLLSTVEWPYYY